MNAETTDKTKTGMLADTDELEVIDQLVHQRSLSGSQEPVVPIICMSVRYFSISVRRIK